jgi:hypothetical protein
MLQFKMQFKWTHQICWYVTISGTKHLIEKTSFVDSVEWNMKMNHLFHSWQELEDQGSLRSLTISCSMPKAFVSNLDNHLVDAQ